MTRILSIEDNPMSLKLLLLLLQREGYDAVGVGGAEEAERSLGEELPDLILMDLGLPGKDGYALTREIRRDPRTSEIPILAVTSFAMKGDEERAREAGCDGYVTKPIERETLLKNVRALLRKNEEPPPEPGGSRPPSNDPSWSGRSTSG